LAINLAESMVFEIYQYLNKAFACVKLNDCEEFKHFWCKLVGAFGHIEKES